MATSTTPPAVDTSQSDGFREGRREKGGEENEPEVLQAARKMLHLRMKVEVTDGRIIIGIFECIDKQGNIIMGNAVEHYRSVEQAPTEDVVVGEDGLLKGHTLGLVMIPKRHRVSAAIEDVI